MSSRVSASTVADTPLTSSELVLAEFGGDVRPVIGPAQAELLRQRRVHIGDVAVDVGFLRPLGKTFRRLALPVDRGAEQIGKVGIEGFQLGFRRLPGGKLGLLGCLGHRTNMVQRVEFGKGGPRAVLPATLRPKMPSVRGSIGPGGREASDLRSALRGLCGSRPTRSIA